MPYSQSTLDEFRVGYDRQKEWIEGRGLLLLIAIYLGGVGGGLYLTSLIIGWKTGLALALGIVGIGKGSAHLLFLGRPLRFWRALLRPHSSWISRGVIFMMLFLVFGLAHYFTYDQGNRALEIASGTFAFCLIIYTGFLMAASPAISFWNNALLPIVFVGASWWSGASLAEAVHVLRPHTVMVHIQRLEPLNFLLGASAVVALFCYLWVNYSSTLAARESVRYLLWSRFSPVFYLGALIIGVIIPIAILFLVYLGEISGGWLAVAGISELAGSFVLRYALLKAGIYPPVI